MRSLSFRMDRLERQLKDKLASERCPLCFGQNVWRMRVNGERTMEKNDPVYDNNWHCRRCGAAALEIDMVTPLGQQAKRNPAPG